MKRLALIVLAVIATPLALGLGAVLVLPVALLLVPAAVIAGAAALPALWLSSSRTPGARGEPPAVVPEPAAMVVPLVN
jgi:hypothetical protein